MDEDVKYHGVFWRRTCLWSLPTDHGVLFDKKLEFDKHVIYVAGTIDQFIKSLYSLKYQR